jgi:hypothetical protein
MADFADECATGGVHELEDVECGIRLVALRTDVALVVQFLRQVKSGSIDDTERGGGVANVQRTFRNEDLMILYILATRHLTTLQKCW